MIVPLLQVAGVADAGGDAAPVVQTASEIAASLGVPLNLAGVLAVFLGLAAIRSAAWDRGVLTTRLRLEFTDRFRGELYAAVAGAYWSEILGWRRSDIQHTLTDCVGRVGGAAFQLLQLAVGATLALVQFVVAAALAGLAWHAIAGARLTMPELALLALVFARVIPTALNLLQWTQTFVNQLPAYAEATALRDDLRTAAEPVEAVETAFAIDEGIEARNLGFQYAGSSESALSDVSFTIPANGIFAVTGPSGSGKSTLADLLLGLLEPTHGSILVDGVPLRGSVLRRWRRSTAYVAQEPFLLHESLRSNLSWARPDATETEMREALRLAAARPADLDIPGYRLHPLKGPRGGYWSISGNWRIVFRFDDGEPVDVDLVDYH